MHLTKCFWWIVYLPFHSGFFSWICPSCCNFLFNIQHSEIFWILYNLLWQVNTIKLTKFIWTFLFLQILATRCLHCKFQSSEKTPITANMCLGQTLFSWVRYHKQNGDKNKLHTFQTLYDLLHSSKYLNRYLERDRLKKIETIFDIR